VQPDQAAAVVQAADAAHGLIAYTLAIKANPPSFNGTISSLASLLQESFGVTASELAAEAAEDLAAISDSKASDAFKFSKAKVRVGKLQGAMAEAGQELGEQTVERLGRYLASAYRLGATEISKPLGWSVAFTLADRDALAGLQKSGLYWIGEHYGEAFSEDQLLKTVREVMLEKGLGRAAAGRQLAATLGKSIKRSDSYWRGLAAVVATRSRSFGAIESLARTGAIRYEFLNPDDEKTSPVCDRLNGTVFYVKGAIALRDQLLNAKTPGDWKTISPWPKVTELTVDGTADGKLRKPTELQQAGIAWPPLHMHCRSSIQVRVYAPLGKGEIDPLGQVDWQAPKPPKVKAPAVALPDVVPNPLKPPPWVPDLPTSLVQSVDNGGDWQQLFRLQGYTDEEINALMGADMAGVLPGVASSDKVIAFKVLAEAGPEDVDLITALMKHAPPANPRQVNAAFLQAADDVHDLNKVGAWFDDVAEGFGQESYESAVHSLKGAGYSEAEIAELFKLDDGILLPALLGPNDDALRVAVYLHEHPPGKVPKWVHPIDAKPAVKLPQPPPVKPPKLPKKPPPPPPAPVPPSKVVPKPPKVPVVHADDLPAGATPAQVHPGYGWQPSKPPKGATVKGKLAGKKVLGKYLGDQGYSAAEVDELVPQLLAHKVDWDAIATAAPKGKKSAVLNGKLVGWLEDRPPGAIVGGPKPPPAFLDPSELGERLRPLGTKAPQELGDMFEDSLTGERWYVRHHANPLQARHQVVAGNMYRELGIEVAEQRLVQVNGQLGVATRELKSWVAPGNVTELLDKSGAAQQLGREFPADAWLGSWNVVGTDEVKIWHRATATPAGSKVIRTDLGGSMAFRQTGPLKPAGGWSASAVPDLDVMLTKAKPGQAFGAASADPSLMLPMLDKIGDLSDKRIGDLLTAGGLDPGDRAELLGVLTGRRDVLRKRAKLIRAELKVALEEAAQHEVELAASRAAQAVRRQALEEAIARGEIIPGHVRRGGTLSSLQAAAETDGAQAVLGDADRVRNQLVRVSRYRMHRQTGKAVDGWELRLQVDEAHWSTVDAGVRRRGGKSESFRTWRRKGLREADDTVADPLAHYEEWNENRSVIGNGLVAKGKDAEIDFVPMSGQPAARGDLRIMIPEADPVKAQRALDRVLADLGMDDAMLPPTEDAEVVMKANRFLWRHQGGKYQPVRTASEARRKLGTLRPKVRPEDLEVREIPGGWVTVVDTARQDQAREVGVRYVYQQFSGSDDSLKAVVGADGSDGGLICTTERFYNGIFKKGMSSSTDMGTGGASSVFTRVVGGAKTAKGNGGSAASTWYNTKPSLLIDQRELARTDWYAYGSDSFGTTVENKFRSRAGGKAWLTSHAADANTGNEVMFRYSVGRDPVLGVAVQDDATRRRMIASLKAKGITTVRDQPVEEFVIVMRSPTDWSNFNPSNPAHQYLRGETDVSPGGWSP
jgi:hypothetical protein